MRNWILGLGMILAVAGCASSTEIDPEPAALGDFSLGHNIVVADNAQLIPPSRGAEPDEWEEVLTAEIDRRFARYEGEKLYHFGVAVEGFALAVPGVPVVLSPKSALVISVAVYDDTLANNGRNGKLAEERKQLTILESFSGDTIVGSGLTKSREQQMQNLAFNAARAIEKYLANNAAEWFGEDTIAPVEEDEATE
ncbi:hypothetical protein ACMU_04910 [Actibacterium mucosum KCTC 23349]|uniref:Lipoprotein n=1 Tax=Actibacterium mucosum KCTC 23349 TaxID=1454373 RepID=A0A037ZBV8_9RHOB|nr:hypothetical protein [Actibacterium mucosum]KAJ53954.1 hypothetical protein ACMU_04910 [Actibacterium mucosum KCTC 23349]